MAGLGDILSGFLKPVADVVDHVLPSGDAKLQLQGAIVQTQVAIASKLLDYESQLLESQKSIVLAEAQGNSFLQRNWRPITMLTFLVLIVLRMFNLTTHAIPDTEYALLWELMKYGLTGYVVGRSAEKTAPAIVAAIKAATTTNGSGK